MKTVIIGRGCVGATVMHNIYENDEAFFLVDKAREYRTKSPIIFNGEPLSCKTITERDSFASDLIINTVKNYDLDSTIELMRPFVGPNTIIMPLQNGIESEAVLSSAFGKDKVIYSFISGLSASREGSSITSFTPGLITFGLDTEDQEKRVEKLRDYFSNTNQPFFVSPSIHHDQWVKFMTNTSFNTLSALLGFNYGEIANNQDVIRALRLVAREVQTVALKENIVITQDDVENMIKSTLSLPPKGRSSMLDDVINGRRTENRWFCGSLSALAKKHSIKTPYSDLLYILLEAKINERESD